MTQIRAKKMVPAIKDMPTALLFAEDPGAALFMQSLPEILAAAGIDVRLMAIKHARRYFPESLENIELGSFDESALNALFDDSGINILIVGTSENPTSIAFPLIDAARSAGIAIVGAVDAIANAEDRFRGRKTSPLHYAPDWLLVPDKATRQAYADIGFSIAHIAVCGHPRMDQIAKVAGGWVEADRQMHREKWLGVSDPEKSVILFASELSVGLNTALFQRSPDYTLNGNADHISRTEIVLDELFAALAKLDFDPFLVLRLHPKQTLRDGATHAGLFDMISHTEPMLEMVHAADLVVGMTSILLVEAAALGRPVLSVVPVIREREWLGELGKDIMCVSTPEGLLKHLSLGASRRGWPTTTIPEQKYDASAAITAAIKAALA